MVILQSERVGCESNNEYDTSESQICMLFYSFEDQLLSRNWEIAIKLIQSHHEIVRSANGFNELPLHTAIWINAPEEIILLIMSKNEDAIFHANYKKQFPIHLAVKCSSSLKVIERLLRKQPHALEEKDDMNITPRDYGISNGKNLSDLLRLPVSFWVAL